MRHFFLIDPLEKLTVKKDSSLFLAQSFAEAGEEVYLFFEKGLYWRNLKTIALKAHTFKGALAEEDFYVEQFILEDEVVLELEENDIVHFRLDPPFDLQYLKNLWLLQNMPCKVINHPKGILSYNEKLYAYARENSLPTYVGSSETALMSFLEQFDESQQEFILKPLDLYQGIGIEKVERDNLATNFKMKIAKGDGPIIVQPFFSGIAKGEIRTIFFKGKEIGTILKTPQEGRFLANIARGASYEATDLPKHLKKECEEISAELAEEGVHLIAFDIMGEHISEVNITCPGLLVEVSNALKKNLAIRILDEL